MLLDFLNDVFLLNLALEPAERVFERLAVLKPYFSQLINTPISVMKMSDAQFKLSGGILTQAGRISQAQFRGNLVAP